MQNHFDSIYQYPIESFKAHFEKEYNNQIIFSGKFGIGKTSFLKNYFSLPEQVNRCNVFYISPIHYSIASNNDIVSYIKYDLIYEFLRKGFDLSQSNLDLEGSFPLFIRNNYEKFLVTLGRLVPKLGKDLSEILKSIVELKKDIITHNNEINKDDGEILSDFLNSIENSPQVLYEMDIVTKIINNTLDKIKSETTNNVLIIDDLDRIDPDHIFRLFNVFGAHFSEDTSPKFHFDKLIFVCDIHNITNLFYNRYGSGIDFSGYIDKFFSYEIYHFDNKKAIISILANHFNQVKILYRSPNDEEYVRSLLFKKGDFLLTVIEILIYRNLLSLRSILRANLFSIDPYKDIELTNTVVYPVYKNRVILQIKFLSNLVGGYNNLQRIFQMLSDNEEEFDQHRHFIGFFLVLLAKIGTFRPEREVTFNYKDFGFSLTIDRNISNDSINSVITEITSRTNAGTNVMDLSAKEYWQLILDSMQLLHRNHYF